MPPPLETDVAIETPEHIVFRHRVAGPSRRLLAQVIDLFICYTAVIVVAVLVVAAAGAENGIAGAMSGTLGAGLGFVLLLLFAAQWVYFVVWEGLTGRTPGKMALDLRVVTMTGRPIGFGAAALRNVLRAADMLPAAYAVGVVSMAISSRFQRLGDLVAGTMVVVSERPVATGPLRLWPPAAPGELASLPDDVRLDADERAAIELFLRRRGALGGPREWELASMVAGPLAARFGMRYGDPTRALALIYDRAVNAGRSDAPPSSRGSFAAPLGPHGGAPR